MEVEKLNDERKRQKLSVAELAVKAGLAQSTVEKILFGVVKNPRNDTMQALERALGLNKEPEWTDEKKAQGVGSHSVKLSADEWEWLELRSELLEAGGQEYLDTITTLLQKSAEISKKKK